MRGYRSTLEGMVIVMAFSRISRVAMGSLRPSYTAKDRRDIALKRAERSARGYTVKQLQAMDAGNRKAPITLATLSFLKNDG